MNCDKILKKTYAKILIPYKRVHSSSFLTARMVGGDDPSYPKFWAKLTPSLQKCWFSIYDCS